MSITLIVGPMFSGKSMLMRQMIERHKIAGKRCIILRPLTDDRHGKEINKITCNDGRSYSFEPIQFLPKLSDFNTEQFDVIGIDEGQFFSDLLLSGQWADSGKTIIVAGLDSDINDVPFGDVCRLVPMSESVSKLKAVCETCGADASFTRLRNSVSVDGKTNPIKIGGKETYRVCCRKCK